ncbi:DNA mismatch repair protein MutS, clamp domain protein, partial [mine drainage metagenome]
MDRLIDGLDPPARLVERLDAAVPEEADPARSDERRFRAGFSADLDRLHDEEKSALADLDRLEREAIGRTGIRSLKIGYNQVFGYYFEVGKTHSGRVPPEFRRRQTLAQGERFTTDGLEAVELRLRELRERLQAVEAEVWGPRG